MNTKFAIALATSVIFTVALALPAASRDAGERKAPEHRQEATPFLAAFAAEHEATAVRRSDCSGRNCPRSIRQPDHDD